MRGRFAVMTSSSTPIRMTQPGIRYQEPGRVVPLLGLSPVVAPGGPLGRHTYSSGGKYVSSVLPSGSPNPNLSTGYGSMLSGKGRGRGTGLVHDNINFTRSRGMSTFQLHFNFFCF